MNKKFNLTVKPDPKEGQAVVRIVEKLAPSEKSAAQKSRDAAKQHPAPTKPKR
jgi:hypothetical protein